MLQSQQPFSDGEANNQWLDELLDDGDDGDFEEQQHSWEAPFMRSWDAIEEGDDGKLVTSRHGEQRARRVRMGEYAGKTSRAMDVNDFRPTRKLVVLRTVSDFIRAFFDQNPISQLGVVVSDDKRAHMLTDLSGNPEHQIDMLQAQLKDPSEGEFSLQNALELARSSLRNVPAYGSREVIVIHSSLTTCDPGDVFTTIADLKRDKIRCSVIALSAESHLFRRLAVTTKGSFNVTLNSAHLDELLRLHLFPPSVEAGGLRSRQWVHMGFPHLVTEASPSMCSCHSKFSHEGYICPRCKSKLCELPTQCQVCGLTLVSSPHLARSYHHLFPTGNFLDITESIRASGQAASCFACLASIDPTENLVLQCPNCLKVMCFGCDAFIHESLHNCPGCQAQ